MREKLAYDREATGDRQQNAIQDISRKTTVAVNQMGSPPVIVGPIHFFAGDTIKIDHKLGRVPSEWVITDAIDGYPLVYRIGDMTDKTITLRSANSTTIMLRIS